jgi:hypothetical protein
MVRENIRQRVRIWHVAAAIGLVGAGATAGWWFAHRVDPVSVVAHVNARYTSVAGYEADIFTGVEGAPLTHAFRRHAVLRNGKLAELVEVAVHQEHGHLLRTYAAATSQLVTVDGHSCWTKTVSDPRQISRDLGIGRPMIPDAERIVSAHRGGHGYTIETASTVTGKSVTTTWDIDDETFLVRSRTTHYPGRRLTRMTVTRELASAPVLNEPGPLCVI